MTLRTTLCCVSIGLALMGAAQAAPATPEEAQRLTTLFQAYVGKPAEGAPSAVTVTPAGESYNIGLNLARLMEPLRAFGVSIAKAGDYELVLTPGGDGTWRVTSKGFPPLAATKDDHTVTFAFEGYTFDGIYDPKLSAFTSATSSSAGTTVGSVSPQASTETQYTGQSVAKHSAGNAGDGTVNARTTQAVTDFGYRLAIKPSLPQHAETTSGLSIDGHAAGLSGELSATNERPGHVLDLWAFLVAHPSRQQLVASQTELKSLLTALLPFASTMTGQAEARKLVVNTPTGQFAFGDLLERLDYGTGKQPDGMAFTLKVEGLTVPPGLVPAWAVGLVPTGLDLNPRLGPLHLGEALRKLVADVDFPADKPLSDPQSRDIAQTFVSPQNAVLTLGPSTITTPLMTLKVEGALHLSEPMPAGAATITATGLDAAIEDVRAAAETTDAAQALLMLTSLKQMARAEPDGTYTWRVEGLAGRELTVNGKPLQGAQP